MAARAQIGLSALRAAAMIRAVDSLVLLPPDVAHWAALTMVAVSFVTSFITAAFGIGGGVIMLAVLAVLLPPVALIPVHGLVQLGSNAGRAAILARQVERTMLLPFTLGSAIGAGLGGVLFIQIPPWLVQLAIGVFIVWAVFGRPPAFGRGHVVAAGAFSSFLTMFFGATGNFVAAMVKTMNLPPLRHVATHSILMTIQHLLKVFAFGLLGFAFGPFLPLIAAMIVSGFLGTVIGKQVLVRMGEGYFKPVLNAILLVLAARLIWSGVSGYFGPPA